jgi:hypothetical protein
MREITEIKRHCITKELIGTGSRKGIPVPSSESLKCPPVGAKIGVNEIFERANIKERP